MKRPVKYCKTNITLYIELIDLRTIRPLDIETILESVRKTNNLVCVEEGWSYSGISSEIITQIIEKGFDYLDSEPKRITGKDVPMPYAENLERASMITAEDIVKVVAKIFNK